MRTAHDHQRNPSPGHGALFRGCAYKTAYDLVDGAFKFEMDNRVQLQSCRHPSKRNWTKIRPVAWDIDQRWALARKSYVSNPTPAGLTALQTIFADLQKLVAVAVQQSAAITTLSPQNDQAKLGPI